MFIIGYSNEKTFDTEILKFFYELFFVKIVIGQQKISNS